MAAAGIGGCQSRWAVGSLETGSLHQIRRDLRNGFLLAPQLLLELLDLPLVLGAELLQLLLLFDGQNRLLIGIRKPAANGPLAPGIGPSDAIGAQLGGIEPSGLQHHREFVSGTPALAPSRMPAPPPLQPPSLPPLVEGHHVDAQLF